MGDVYKARDTPADRLTGVHYRSIKPINAHNETRRAVLSRFPYAIYCPMTDDDVVQAVHGRQHPSRWRTRS